MRERSGRGARRVWPGLAGWWPGLAASGVLLLLTACATGGGGAAGGPGDGGTEADASGSEPRLVRIVVQNDIRAGTTVDVYVVTDAGSRHRLGSVQPGFEEAFTYEPRQGEMGRPFRLLAETNAGERYRSDSFTFAYVGEITWRVR